LIELDLYILGNFGKSILHLSTRLEDSIEKLKETVQAYTNAIVDLGLIGNGYLQAKRKPE